LLTEFGMADRGRDKVGRYSGGMAQRLMIARALMHAPDVLFLDEPTNNLDPQSRLFLWDRIRTLRDQGLTILLTTHDMEEADQLCDRIAIMDHGKILVDDTAAELKKLIPGGNALDLRVRASSRMPANDGAVPLLQEDKILTALRALPGALSAEAVAPDGRENDGERVYRLYAEDAGSLLAGALTTIAGTGVELRDLHLTRPSLENVFIYLTGRNLR
jgi:ABC-2 type transport system ATP-binding protein